MDTLALGYTLPAIGRVTDLHRLENIHAGRTKQPDRCFAIRLNFIPSACCRSQLPREHDGVSGPRLRLRLRYRTGQPRTFSDKEPLYPAPALRFAARLMASPASQGTPQPATQTAPQGA